MRPLLTEKFRATTIPKAFLLNSIVIAVIATIGIEVRAALDADTSDKTLTQAEKGGIIFATTFISGLLTYIIMYVLVNYGGGQLSTKKLTAFKWF
jgi:hypothetical protein